MKVIPTTQVDHLVETVTNGWRSAGEDRSKEYAQFSWDRVFDPSEILEESR